jgi:predicted RNA-binding protein Jag
MAQRFEGKNLDEALTAATTTLGVQRSQLTYTVLLEKRGFLGGVKHVVVEADVNEAAVPPSSSAPAASADVDRESDGGAASPAPAPSGNSRGDRGPRARGARGGGRSGGGGRGGNRRGGERGGRGGDRGGRGGERGRGQGRDEDNALQPGDFEQFAELVVPEQGSETEGAAAVRAWCEEVIDLSRLDLLARTEENDTQIIVKLYGRDARRVLDRQGELLDAIQVLANKALVGRKLEKDIELDCQDFKSQRVDDIGGKARDLAERVRHDGREQLLPAMSPIERRIVHLALQDDPDVTTESRGEGFFKRVAVIPRPAAAEGADPQEQTNSAS